MAQEVPDGAIVITPKEFYDGVSADIAEIKAAVSPIPHVVTKVDDHERRITKLERLLWLALGASLATGGWDFIAYVN